MPLQAGAEQAGRGQCGIRVVEFASLGERVDERGQQPTAGREPDCARA